MNTTILFYLSIMFLMYQMYFKANRQAFKSVYCFVLENYHKSESFGGYHSIEVCCSSEGLSELALIFFYF